jgi:hypothetical protein
MATTPEEPTDEADPFDAADEEEGPTPLPTWLGAIGQMLAALLVVIGLVVAFVGLAALLRRVLP